MRGHNYSAHLGSLVGKRFGLVTVVSTTGGSRTTPSTAIVLCDCGKLKTVGTGSLSGFLKNSKCRCNAIPAGMAWVDGHKTPEYESYCSMMSRCYNARRGDFKYYGGRGIQVCKSWRGNFVQFLADMGARPEGKTLEREDCDKDYSPGNCSWADHERQMNNTRKTVFIEQNGVRMSRSDWARRLGVNYSTLRKRQESGLPLEGRV